MFKTDKITILLVAPNLGGGTTRHVKEMAAAWSQQGYNCLLLETHYTMARLFKWNNVEKKLLGVFSCPQDEKTLLCFLVVAEVAVIHYHHFLYMDRFYYSLPSLLQVPFYVTLHDYYIICPIIKLNGLTGDFCKLPPRKVCNRCLSKNKFFLELTHKLKIYDIYNWRDKWKNHLLQATRIFVPSSDAQKRLSKILPELELTVFENPEITPVSVESKEPNVKLHILRVGVIGGLDKTKGASVILAVAEEIVRQKLPIELILFGYLKDYKGNLPKSLTVLGKYTEEQIYQQINENAIDYFIFPAILPETYSYTLSIPVRLGIPVLGVNIGAIGERIQEHGWGELYPYDSNAEYICNRLMSFDYKIYACKKDNFIIENITFPNAKKLYGSVVAKKAVINTSEIDNYLLRFNDCIKYVDMKNVIASDFRVLKPWGLSWLAIIQLIFNIKWSWMFKQIFQKMYKHVKQRIYF